MTPAPYSAPWFEAVLNAMSEFVLVKGERSKLLWANDAFLRYYGLTNEQLQGIIDAPHSDPDDTLQYVRDDHEVFTTGRTLEVVEPVTDSTGAVGYFTTIKSPFRLGGELVVGSVGTSRPTADAVAISQGESVRQARKEGLVDTRALVTHIPQPVAMIDVKQRIVAHSRAWNALFAAREWSVGDYYDDAFGSVLDLEGRLSLAIESGEAFVIEEASCEAQPGTHLLLRVHGQPFALPDGSVGGVVLVVQDLTELRRNEAELERANDELTQFNYRVSHDIVAPLRSIKGLAAVCQSRVTEGVDPVLDGALLRLNTSADALSGLITNLMALARADVAAQASEPVDVAALVESSLALHGADAANAGIEVRVDVQGTITSELVRVQQCVENLIGNSIKYVDARETEPYVHVALRRAPDHIVFEVSDNGLGLEPGTAERVFDQFFRGNSRRPGNGLGLYLVAKHVQHLGGSVAVSSERKPTRFTLTLPTGSPA